MTTAAQFVDANGKPVKMNSRAGRALPDVEDYQAPLALESIALIEAMGDGRLTPDEFHDQVAALHARIGLPTELRPWIDRALEERKDQVLYQKTFADTAYTLQLLYLDPREVHPPHAHHNLVSRQVLLHGRVYLREYDRVARLAPDVLLLRLRQDGWMRIGEAMRTTEIERNAHWFAADDQPAVMLNFYCLGYQEWTFDKPDGRPKGRRCLDPTQEAQRDGLIVARELDYPEAYAKFGGVPMEAFAVPRPARH